MTMWWSKQRKRNMDALSQHLASHLATVIIAVQKRVAMVLHLWEQKLSQRQKKVVLFIFITCCSLYLAAILAGVLLRDDTEARAVGSGIPPTIIAPPILPQRDSTATEFFKH